jgi:hypothetical protein
MNTKDRGDRAVGQAICYFISKSYEVCLPIGDKRDYDFVIENNGHLEKVQVKFAGLYKSGVCKVGLRITGGNQSFSYSRKYKDSAFDWLFVYTERGHEYLLPWKDVECRNEINIEHLKYRKYQIK